ncbi:MAG: hypothetical protein WA705_14040 [Candidatus Ozemobacteraceae bacterium]
MSLVRKIFVVLAVIALPVFCGGALQAAPTGSGATVLSSSDTNEFRPEWHLGDSWIVEARYRNLAEAADAWLPPVRWRFHVRAQKEIAGEPCWMLHIVPLGRPDMKVQGVLWLSCRDLRPMRVADVFPVRGIAKSKKREFSGSRITPLFSEGAMIPYDFPLFPLADESHERSGSGTGTAVTGEKAVTSGEITFVDQVSQSWKHIPGGFEVLLNDGGAKGIVRQVWRPGYPWAVLHIGQAVEARLVEPRPAEDDK